MINLPKLLLPYFPDSKFLREHWWHRLIKIITLIISGSSLYSIVWLIIFSFLVSIQGIGYNGASQILITVSALPLLIPGLIITRFINPQSATWDTYTNIYNQFSSLSSSGMGILLLFIPALIILYLILPLLYRLILYIVFNNGWRK